LQAYKEGFSLWGCEAVSTRANEGNGGMLLIW
jgi:hypothetical protein